MRALLSPGRAAPLWGIPFFLILIAWVTTAGAQAFSSQGPAPSIYPDSAGLGFNGNWAGAIQSVLVNPSNANVMLISSVNGGVWQTLNGGTTWAPLTDRALSLSVDSLSYDPNDPTHTKIFAGVGLTSNGAIAGQQGVQSRGGDRVGILYSSDGGAKWSVMGNRDLAGMSVVAVEARDSTILAATFEPQDMKATGSYGLYRSIDSGANFSLVTTADGLSSGAVTSLIGVPDNPKKLYAAVANQGVFESPDGGQKWNVIQTYASGTYAHLASGPGGAVAVAMFNDANVMIGLKISKNYGVDWYLLNVPQVNNGSQASVNLAIAIDPKNTNIVYLAGDSAGGSDVSLAAYRVVFDPNTNSSTYSPLSYISISGVTNTAVHADARSFAFLPNGTMVMAQDAGIYLRPNPQGDGTWTALNTSTLSVREAYALAFDAVSKRLVVAAQDTGTARQVAPGGAAYASVDDGGGDGFNSVINDKTHAREGISVLYESSQNIGAGSLMRWTYGTAGNTSTSTAFQFGKGLSGSQYLPFLASDYTDNTGSGTLNALPMASKVILNRIDPTMLAFGTNYVYVARDVNAQAQYLAEFVNVSTQDNKPIPGGVTALVYGTRDNVHALLAGGTDSLYISTTAESNSLYPLPSYAALTGVATPTGIVFDARTQNRFYVADASNLWASNDRGSSFSSLTGNFTSLGITRPTSVEFISSNGVQALLTGGVMNSDAAQSPIVLADSDTNGNLTGWRSFGLGLPNAIVNLMSYNDTADVLAISSFGRGVWVLYDVTSYFPQALVLRYGLADNDSAPAVSLLTGARPLEKYGIGTLSINGVAAYSGSTSVYGGTLALIGSGSIFASSGLFIDTPGSFDISASNSGASIRTLSGSGMIRLGSTAMTITNGSDTFSGSITDGGIGGGVGGRVIIAGGVQGLAGLSTYSGGTQVLGGTLSIGGIYPLGTGPVSVAPGATLMGTGTIIGATTVAGTLKPGYSPGFLATKATVTMTSGSSYLQDIAGTTQATSATPAGSAGYYSSLQVTGGQFVIQPGSNLTVRLSDLFSPGEPGYGSPAYTPQLGDKFRVVNADGGVMGKFPTIAQPAGLSSGTQLIPFYNVAGNNSLDVFAIPQSYSVATASTANGNGRSVASALDQILRRNFANTSTANQDQLLYAVAGQTAAGLPSYVTSLAGELYGASLAVVPQATQRVQQSVLARLGDTYPAPAIATAGAALTNAPVNPLSMEVMNGKTPGGPAPFYVSSNPAVNPTAPVAGSASLSSGAAWGEIAFQRGNRSGDDNASGYSSNLYQAVFGVDAYSEHGRKFGGGLAISTTSVWANGGTSTVQQGALFLYGKLPLDSWVVDGMASYGMNTTDNQRTSLVGLTDTLQAKGVRGNDALLSLGASRPIEFEDVRVTPYARLTWQQVSQSGFAEGSTPAALTVDRFNGNAVRGTLGLAVGSTSVNPMNDLYTYRGYIGVGADSPGLMSPMLNASLAGMPTTISTPSVGSTFVQAGLYATAKVGESAFGYLGVSAEARSGQTLAGVAVGVRIQY